MGPATAFPGKSQGQKFSELTIKVFFAFSLFSLALATTPKKTFPLRFFAQFLFFGGLRSDTKIGDNDDGEANKPSSPFSISKGHQG